MRRTPTFVALCVALVLVVQSLVIQHVSELDSMQRTDGENQPPSIVISQQHGGVFSNLVEIHGMVWDEQEPQDVEWWLYEGSDQLIGGTALSSLVEEENWVDAGTRAWHWTVSFSISSRNPCTCQLLVTVTDQAGHTASDIVLLFGLDEEHSTPPNILISEPLAGAKWRGTINLTGVVVDDDSNLSSLQWGTFEYNPTLHPEGCIEGFLQSALADSIEWNSEVEQPTEDYLFDIAIDTTQMADGWHMLVTKGSDNLGNFSDIACTYIALNNQLPIASISGPFNLTESQTAHFDASLSDDPFWGKDGLHFTFIVHRVGTTAAPLVVDVGTERSWGWVANSSGTFDVQVMVTDSSGLSNVTNITLVVNNVPPTALATVEGISLGNEMTIRLSDAEYWRLDGTASQDTEYDQGGLDYIWYLDGEPIFEGAEQILRRDRIVNEGVTHRLTLSVTDDDGQTDWVESKIGIEGTQSDPEWVEPASFSERVTQSVGGSVNMLLLFMLAMVIIAGLTLRLTSGVSTSSIPKWVPRPSQERKKAEDFEREDLGEGDD